MRLIEVLLGKKKRNHFLLSMHINFDVRVHIYECARVRVRIERPSLTILLTVSIGNDNTSRTNSPAIGWLENTAGPRH